MQGLTTALIKGFLCIVKIVNTFPVNRNNICVSICNYNYNTFFHKRYILVSVYFIKYNVAVISYD